MSKVKESSYLAAVKPQLVELRDRLRKEYEYVSILAEDSSSRQFSVSKAGVQIAETPVLGNRGVVIKVYDGDSYGEYAFNRVTPEELGHAEERIRTSLMPMRHRLPDGVTVGTYKKAEDVPCLLNESTEYEIHPDEYGEEKLIDFLSKLHREGMAMDDRILNCNARFQYQQYSKLFLSEHRDMLQNVLWSCGSINASAANGEMVQSSFQSYSLLGGAELLDRMKEGLPKVIRTTLELLESEPITPGEYDCICTPEVTGMIVHEAFGHGVEMDMFVKKRALAERYIGKQVASELITMHDGASAAKETATFFFDDEGVLAQDTTVIENGILKTGICDSQSAMCLGIQPTGNGRRQSFDHKAYTRMTNTFFEEGKDSYEDMVASISYGFQLEEATSGMEDPKNWGIQCMVNIAREIKDGKFTGRIFSPIVLTGYVPDLLCSISMVSGKKELGGGGFCGKGYKEWVKVSDGGPYIKARIRLG